MAPGTFELQATISEKLDTIIKLLKESLDLTREAIEFNRKRAEEVRGIEAINAKFIAKNEALLDLRLAEVKLAEARRLVMETS